MEWIYESLKIFALFLTTLWFFTWLCESRNGSGWLFALRRQLAFQWILMRQKVASRATSSSSSMMRTLIDDVSDLKHDTNIISYYGTDQRHNHLFIRINHRLKKPSELVLFLRLDDGRTYELPDHPNTVISDIENSTWSATDLKIHVLQSTKRTRILFNGLLRLGNRKDINCDIDVDVQHIRLNCIFIANTKPYFQKEYWSTNLLTETLAHSSWKKSKWNDFLNKLDVDQIDQYGSIMAQVTFEDSSIRQLYLRGMRTSQWGKFDAIYFERNFCITGTDTLGISFHLRLSNLKDDVKNIRLGHVKNHEDNLHPIQSMNFDVDEFMNRYNNGFDEYSFQFSAGKRKYEALIKLHRETLKTFYGGSPWDSQYIFCRFELKLNNISGVGMIQLCEPFVGPCPINIPSPKKLTLTSKPAADKQVYTLLFEDQRCRNECLVGGKGASLAELTAIETTKFIVPKGFCITTNALDAHIKCHANLTETIDEFVKVCCEEKAGDTKERTQKVIAVLQSTPMLHAVQAEILRTFEMLDSKSTYAVRSSAVGEDSDDTSAAGQNSTYLGIESVDKAIMYVTHCWASLYTHQSVEYRRQHGLPIKASMGVCVQQMVDAEAAGVMFTRHPITGNPKEILITSNYGLGESVVSALADPDTIIVQRDKKNSLTIKSSTIGKKSRKVTVNSDIGGTVHADVSESAKSKLSINDELSLKLAEIGVMLDKLYNAPRDIEWAVSKGQIYLLQCRPVTALDAWTEFELIHELGGGVPSDSDILTLANVGEVLPMVATPLTISTIIHALNISVESSIERRLMSDNYKHGMFIVNSKCFLNYANFFLRYVEERITLGSKVMEIAVCGHTVITPELNELGLKRNGGPAGKRDRLKLLCEMGADLWNNSRAVRQANETIERCRMISKTMPGLSANQLHKLLGDIMSEHVNLTMLHTHTTRCSVFSQVLMLSILSEGNEQLSMEHYSDIAVLLGSCSDVISAQVPLTLKQITQTIKENDLSEDFKQVNPSEALSWLLTHCPKVHNQVQKFIEIHGHRGIEEFELITETWGMKPEKFLLIVQSMLDSPTDNNTKTSELSPRETVALLKTPRKSSTRWVMAMLLPWMRRTVSQREHTKCLLIELVHIMRMGYRKLAEMLVQEGTLPEQELVFFLTREELAKIVRTPCPSLIRKAVRRRKLRPKLQKYKYNEISYGMPKPIKLTKLSTFSGGARIQGTSVCNGVATGRACVALSLKEAALIRSGDILITQATDIGWSPYFPLLAGVVTELGGLISHGAVVAREYGLPCIVSAENATRIFTTGDTVTLNGYAGTIEFSEAMHREKP
ncbi:uncharacterized protein LOC131673972 [Phymastichus coffea]|uniref:uncharacterized protein LOC131673972 n=1 Tax=Phymastichus coffea TaxID=108790 RepID=UPI00273A75F5|nr:uncharacterized protein LOC131673972 [Phymastichus coffea]